MEAAVTAGVPRFVFVSVHDYNIPDLVKEKSGYFSTRPATIVFLDAIVVVTLIVVLLLNFWSGVVCATLRFDQESR